MAARTNQEFFSPLNAVTGVAGILFGLIVGFILGTGQPTGGAQATGLPADHPPTTSLVNENELQAYRNILASDPDNVRANVELGNKLYDGGRYAEAIPYYQKALTLNPKDVNVSTDLGTALYYAGRVDDALAQLDKSLAINAAHGQTLFNIGIIRRDGKKDARGAVEAWERLLSAVPNYPEADRVRRLIAESKA